jgi:hypothetical protein
LDYEYAEVQDAFNYREGWVLLIRGTRRISRDRTGPRFKQKNYTFAAMFDRNGIMRDTDGTKIDAIGPFQFHSMKREAKK